MKQHKISPVVILRGTMYLLSLNLLVFLRRQLGERLAADLCIACGFSWFCFWVFSAVRAVICPASAESVLPILFVYSLSVLTVCHLIAMWLRRVNPATIQSYWTGRPTDYWRILGISDLALQRYVQPIACLFAAFIFFRWDGFLAYWIGVASVAVFVEEQLARFQMRRRVLDTIDGRLNSEVLYRRVQERTSPASALTSATQSPVIEMSEPLRQRADNLESIRARLDPEIQKMLEPHAAAQRDKL